MRSWCLVALACALFVAWSPAVVAASETDASGIYCQSVGDTQVVCLFPPDQTTVDLEQDLLPTARSFNSAVNVETTMTVFAHGGSGSKGREENGPNSSAAAGGPGGYGITTTNIKDIADALDGRPILNYFTATTAKSQFYGGNPSAQGGASSLVALGELLQIEDDAQTPEESGILLIAGGGGAGGHASGMYSGYEGGRGGLAIADIYRSVSGAGSNGEGDWPGLGGHEGHGGGGRRGEPGGGHGIGGPGGSSRSNGHWVGPVFIDQLRRANGNYFGLGGEGQIGGGGGWGGGGATVHNPFLLTSDSGGGGGGSFALRSTQLSADDAGDAMWEVIIDQGLVQHGRGAVRGNVGVVFSVSDGPPNTKASYQVYYNHDREIWRADVTARLYQLDDADVVKTRLIEDTGVGVHQLQSYGLGVDQIGNSLYWSTGTSIMRSTLDGDDVEPFVEELGGTVWNFEIDPESRAIYWIETDSDAPGYSIWRAGLDEAVGTPVELCSEDTNTSPFWANLTIDTTSRRAIWSDNISQDNRELLVQDLDVLVAKAGSGASCDPEVLPTPEQQGGEHPTDPRKTYSDLAFTNGHVYWMSSPGGSSDRTPRSIPIDGGDGTMINHDELRFANPGGSGLGSGMDARKSGVYEGCTVIADAGLSGVRLMHLLSDGTQAPITGLTTFLGAASSDVVIVLDPPK